MSVSIDLGSGLKPTLPDPYDAVLADLRAKRDALDAHITFLEGMRDSRLGIAPALTPPQVDPSSETAEDQAGMFLGMSIVDASKKLLKLRKRQLANAEILQNLQAGGMVLTGSDPLNVVSSVLTRRFNTVGDVVRVSRGTWGLKEWYPGRNFKPATKIETAGIDPAVDPESDAAEQEALTNEIESVIGARA